MAKTKKKQKNKERNNLNCCRIKGKEKKCIRNDGKVFKLPRKFSKKQCNNFFRNKNKGFSIIASCSPFKNC